MLRRFDMGWLGGSCCKSRKNCSGSNLIITRHLRRLQADHAEGITFGVRQRLLHFLRFNRRPFLRDMVNTAVGKNLALLHRQMPEAVKHQVRIAAIYNGRTDDGTVLLKKLIWIQAGQRVQRMVHDRASLPVQRLTVELPKQGRGSSAENHAEGGVTSLLFQSELGIEFGEFSAKAD